MKPFVPMERAETVRDAIARVLREGVATGKDLSVAARVSEKDLAEHLEHLGKSLKADGQRLVVHPASCIACGYQFTERKRFTKPGACPKCRSTRIDPPAFSIEGG